jgi:hypothetical protein
MGVPASTREGPGAGLFNERPPYVPEKTWGRLTATERKSRIVTKDVPFMRFVLVQVKHDNGLALIYGAVLGGWAFLLADSVLSLPAPKYLWPPAPQPLAQILAGAIGLGTFLMTWQHFLYHDRERFRPVAPPT